MQRRGGTLRREDGSILICRSDLAAVQDAMEMAGFTYRHAAGLDMFLDGPDAKARDAVHIVMGGEKVRDSYLLPAPDVGEAEQTVLFRVLTLDALVRMKLTSYRRKDQVHLLDMIDVGLIDAAWPSRFPAELGARLQELLDNPDS